MPSDKEILDWIEKNFDRLAGDRPTKRPPPSSPFTGFYVYWGKSTGGDGNLRRAVAEKMAADVAAAPAPFTLRSSGSSLHTGQEDTMGVIGADGKKYHLFLTRAEEDAAVARSPLKVADDLIALADRVGAAISIATDVVKTPLEGSLAAEREACTCDVNGPDGGKPNA